MTKGINDNAMLRHIAPYLVEDASVESRAALLESSGWKDDLVTNDLETFSKFLTLYDIPANTVIFSEGHPSNYLSIIVEGSIIILKENHDHSTMLISQINAGKFLGELAFVDEFPRSATAKTTDHVKLLVLSPTGFSELTQEFPLLSVKLLKKVLLCISQRLRETSEKLVQYLSF